MYFVVYYLLYYLIRIFVLGCVTFVVAVRCTTLSSLNIELRSPARNGKWKRQLLITAKGQVKSVQ